MDPRDRADAALARASARSRWVVTPNNATSPMDAKPTVQIPRVVVNQNDPREQDPDTTVVLPGSVAAGQVPVPQQQAPTQQIPRAHQSQPLPHVQPRAQHSQPLPHVQPTQQLPQPPQQRPEPETKQLPGIIPTTQQNPGRRISLTDRLSGALPEDDQP